MLVETKLNEFTDIQISKPRAKVELIPASEFTFQQLTNIYNQTREDYIVPMPMSQAKMREYVHCYDVDLTQSVVAVSENGPLGLAMLGIRDDATWVTRVGVTPNGRQKGVGRGMMQVLIDNSRKLKAKTMILEVIKNNVPAQHLFDGLGFKVIRELLVMRRPPAPMNMSPPYNGHIKTLGYQDALSLLATRTDDSSWITDNRSLYNAGNLAALVADLPDLGRGWLVYQNTVFQLSRLILQTETQVPSKVAAALLQYLHWLHPTQDTSLENLAVDNEHWPAFKRLGYLISFVRVEMSLDL